MLFLGKLRDILNNGVDCYQVFSVKNNKDITMY